MTRELWELERDLEFERMMLNLKLSRLAQTMSLKSLAGDATDHVVGAGAEAVARFLGRDSAQTAAIAPLISTVVGWALRPKPAKAEATVQPAAFATATETGAEMQDHTSTIRKLAQELRAGIELGTEELSEEARARVIAAREEAIAAAEEAAGLQHSPRTAADFVRDNPVAVGAACLALGAVIAGAFLMRDKEKTAARKRRKRFDQADHVFNQELERLRSHIHAQGTDT